MERTRPERRQLLLEAVCRISEATRIDEFPSVLPALRELFASDVALCSWAPGTRPTLVHGMLGQLHEHPEPVPETDPQLAILMGAPPGIRMLPLTRLVGRRRLHESPAYDRIYHPNRIDEVMSAVLTVFPPPSTGHLNLMLGRKDPFSSTDEAHLAQIVIPLAAFARRTRHLERIELAAASLSHLVDARAAHPVLFSTCDGQIVWQSEASKRVLRAATGTDGKLPQEIAAATAGLDASNSASVEGKFITDTASIAFELQKIPNPHGETVVLIELMPDARRPLTPSERRVLVHLEHGRTLKEIAAIIGVSRETVRTHTRNVYRKYGVASRAELLASQRL